MGQRVAAAGISDAHSGQDYNFGADPNMVLDDHGSRWREFVVTDDVVLAIVHDECVVTEEAVGSDLDRRSCRDR